jgi:DNA-binding ferritin-like protein (Dps family)
LLTSKIKTELNKAKPLIKDKIKQGKYTADVQDKLDDVLKNWNTPRSQALDNIANATEHLDNGTIDFIEYTDILDTNTNIGVAEMNSQELSDTLDYIRELKNLGRSERKARADKLAEERKQRNDKLISIATGGKGITEAEAPIGFVASLRDLGNKIVNWQVAFTDLMDIISQKEGKEKYQGSFNEFADNRISKARNAENDGRIKRSEYVLSNFSRIFGTQSDRLRNKLMNEQQRNKIDLGSFRNSEGNLRNLRYTKAELFDLYLSFQDETKIEEFKSNNKFTDEMINAIKSNLTTKEIAWCDFVLEFLDTYYDDINKVYRNKYGINLSKNKNYWMRTRDIDKSDTPEHIMQMKDMANRASTLSSNLKEARRNKTPYKIMSAHDKLINYVSQMEHFMAWTDAIQELRSVFGNRDVRTAIAENYGDDMNRYINRTIDNLARGGIESAKRNRFLDALRGNFSVAVLGLKPMIAIKQPIAILGFMTEMPYGDFVSGVIDFMKNPVENYRILYSKSSGLRSRYQNGEWERDFATKYNKTRTVVGTNMPMSDFFLYLIRLADMAGTVPGQWAKYKSSLKRGLSDENAILSSEQSVNRTQNTSYLETMSAVQTEGSWAKLLTMFQDQTNKYFRLMMAQTRVIFNNAQTPKAKVKAFSDLMILWVVLPALFQFMSDGFKWRPDRQGRAVVLGPVNYLLIFGQMAQSVYGWTTGEKYPYEPSPVLQIFDDVNYFINDVQKMIEAGQDPYKDITMDDIIRMVEDLAKFTGEATGIPTPYLIQVEKALRSGKLINLLYSDWALQDPKPDDYSQASELVSGLGQTTLTDEEYAKWQEDILNGIKTDDPPIFTMSNLNSEFNKLFSNMLPDKVMSLAGSNGLLIEWASKENAWGEVGILPNVSLMDINTYSNDDTIIQYHKQWLERQKLTKLSDIVAFDKQYPKAYLGNVTESQYNALLQWINISKLPDTKEGNALKEAFLKQHQDITVNPREQYLIEHPDINAKLFIFGQANIYSYKAFKEVMKLVEKYNIPLETLDKAKLAKVPTENVSALLKAYNLLPAGSKRTALRTKYPVLDAYLVKTLGYKPVNNKWLLVTADKIFALDEYNKNR